MSLDPQTGVSILNVTILILNGKCYFSGFANARFNFLFWRMLKSIFLSFREQIYYFDVGTCADLFFRFGACANLYFHFSVLEQLCLMRKSIFSGLAHAGPCANLFFSVLTRALFYYSVL